MFRGGLICLFVVIFSTLVHDSHMTITTIEKYVGDDVVLKCDLSGGTYPAWQQDDHYLTFVGVETFRNIVDKDRVSYDENNRDLHIKELKTSDSGVYRCMMSNGDGYTVQLNVTCCRETLHRYIGGHATFNCPLTRTFAEWYGPDDQLFPDHRHKLHIKHLRHDHAGVYKCKVPSAGTHSFYLNILVNTSATLTGYAGDEVLLECKLPQTLPYWYSPEISEVPLMHAGSTEMNPYTTLVKEGRLSRHKNDRDLVVRNLKTTDAGRYKCFMFRAGTHSINLEVRERQLENTQSTHIGSGMERTHVTTMPFVAMAVYLLVTALFT